MRSIPTPTFARLARLAWVGAALALLAAACGGGNGAAVETADAAADPPESDAADDAGAPVSDAVCLLDEQAVSQAVGREVVFDGTTVGGTGAADAAASLDPEGVDVVQEDLFSVGWEGCLFEADDGTSYMAGELVDDQGAQDLSGFEQLVAWAADEGDDGEDQEPPAVGDGAFVGDGQLVVRDADRTVVVGFGGGGVAGTPTEDEVAGLAEIAAGVVSAGPVDLAEACDAGLAAAPSAWGPFAAPLLGGGGGTIEGVAYSFDSCSTDLPDGSRLEIQFADAELFDLAAAQGESSEREVPELVSGLGDAAVRLSGRLFVRVGDAAATVNATTSDHDPGDPAEVEALGSAVVAALG